MKNCASTVVTKESQIGGTMSDLIHASDAIQLCISLISRYTEKRVHFHEAKEIGSAFIDLPSADRPKGKWIGKNGNRKRCENCGEFALYRFVNVGSFKEEQSAFCPNCGADMRKSNG